MSRRHSRGAGAADGAAFAAWQSGPARTRARVPEPCHHGCRLTDAHYPPPLCDGRHCRGCLPRPADVGFLCQWCRNELERDLDLIGDRLSWLDALATTALDASAAAPDDVVTRTGDPAESLVLHPAALMADEARSVLAFYVHVVLDERGLTVGPHEGDAAAWLRPHLDWLCGQEYAHDLRAELQRVAAAIARFPHPDDVDPPRTLDQPCPRCDQIALVLTPPRSVDRPTSRVECTNPDCARVYSEGEWARFEEAA